MAAAGLILGLAASFFAVGHFAMTTDTNRLLSKSLPWRQREAVFNALYQPGGDQIVIVVDGRTPELAEAAAARLTTGLQARADLFRTVDRPDAGPFFAHEGLLFESLPDVRANLAQLISAQPFLGPLAADPTLRGLMGTLSTALQGVSSGQASLVDIDRPISSLDTALSRFRAGQPAYFSWRTMISGKPADPRELRRLVIASPVLDFARLQPGEDASKFIRTSAARLGLDPAHGVSVRLTGTVPLQDEEFASLADRAALIGVLALTAIACMLWLAVRSPRLIGVIITTMLIGLVTAAAIGLAVFQRFNVISVAFIPLFVGLGIDFGIQFTVRFRAELAGGLATREALIASGAGMGRSLSLAATAIAVGFLAFAPTDYVGVSQLGVIAGLGMFIALALNLTILPALIRLVGSGGSRPEENQGRLERLDSFILSHRRLVVGTGVAAALGSAALLPWLQFDFNPLHLKSARTESVSTLLDLMRDPDITPNTLEVIAPSLAAADSLAPRLGHLPEVSQTRTLSSFVPADQPPKLAAIADAANLLDLTLDPLVTAPPPADSETVTALTKTANDLRQAAGGAPPGLAAVRPSPGRLPGLARRRLSRQTHGGRTDSDSAAEYRARPDAGRSAGVAG